MNLEITIIENNPNELASLTNSLNLWANENNFHISIYSYDSGEAYFSSKSSHRSNLFLLDIQLDGMNGVEIAKQLRSNKYEGEIIFLTSFREYVFDGYQVHALNYLLKPIDHAALYACLNEITESLKTDFYVFRYKQDIIQIAYQDILTFSSSLHNVDILTPNEHFTQYTSLSNVINYLPKQFVRVHRSYIVNLSHIHKISGNVITLSNRTTVPIGRQYINNIRQTFSEYSARFDI